MVIESTDAEANNIGWSNSRPWLQQGYTYNLTLPEGYIINGYELTTLNVQNFTGTFTYTTATGTEESEAQSSTEKRIVVAGLEVLNTNQIQLTVNGTASAPGILIPSLNIYYEVKLPTEITYTVDKTNGNLYKNGTTANQSWNNTWKSNAEPQLLFGCGPNNMNWVDNNVQLMTGSAGSATYTLTPPTGYVITDYSFTFANNGHETGLELTMDNGAAYTTKTEAQTISGESVKVSSVSFTLKGSNNNGVVLTNFTVTVKEDVVCLLYTSPSPRD